MAKRGSKEWRAAVTAGTLKHTPKGEDHGRAQLTNREVLEVRQRWADAPRYPSTGRVIRGWVKREAEALEIPVSTLTKILGRHTWKHVGSTDPEENNP